MRRSEQIEAILQTLAAGPASAQDLLRAHQMSQPVLSRVLSTLRHDGQVIRLGTTRGARYGLARSMGRVGSHWPLYQIDDQGVAAEIGRLHAIERFEYYVAGGPQRLRALVTGIPYVLQDARPGGFLGRAIPHQHPELDLPGRIRDWSDDHFLLYLTQRAPDNTGDLILGEASLNLYLAHVKRTECVRPEQRATQYPRFAAAAMAGDPPGSSAQGEQPKFLARLDEGDRQTHVLVKFSPPHVSEAGRRWADLLRCEHWAHQLLASAGVAACKSRWFSFADRAFLEVERFDRIGAEGRRGTASLLAVDLARYRNLDRWSECARRLHADRLLSQQDVQQIELLESFGLMIANTDRHFGNVTLFDHYAGPFELSPVYDMLPMLFAPHHEQILDRRFEPPTPTAALLREWPRARELAERYWERLATDALISASFREICAQAFEALHRSPAVRTSR